MWGDVDVAAGRFRVARGKTKAARRWVTPPPELFTEVLATCPLEDRLAERLVFPGHTNGSIRHAMYRACKHAGIPAFSPHDLRHRYISRLVQEGVPITQVQALAGHSRASVTLDVYSHVILED